MQTEVPGFLGLLPDDDGIASLLRFEETEDTVAPADALGALSAVRPAGIFPAVADGYTSRARDCDGTTGIQATDATGALILERSVSVVALVEWDHASTPGPDTIVAHGVRGSAEERRSWHLRLSKLGGGIGRVSWAWEDRAGVEYVQDGGEFFLPASGFMMVSAAREWCGDQFLLRYWIGETLLAEHTSGDLEVGGGLGATVTIGCCGDGAGSFAEHFHGRIDQVGVFRSALTQAQVRHIWRRVALWGPDLYRAVRDLQPVGAARTREPSSLVQRRIRTQSGALAGASALVALRADAGLPDRAFGPRLELWERTTGRQHKSTDSVATRQARVLAALRGEQGLSAEKILENLAPLYGLDAGELEVIRYSNVTRGVEYPAWEERGAGGVLVDEPDDEITLVVPLGASWSTTLGDFAYRTSIGAEPILTATVEATTLSNDDIFVGFADNAGDAPAGVKLDTSALQLINTVSGASLGAYVLPVTVRVYLDGTAVHARINGGASVALGTVSADMAYAQVALIPTTSSPPASARSARLSDVRVQDLDSRATQVGYIYGATATDIAGARRQLARQQPAQAHCAALVGRRGIVCDDELHGTDGAPLPGTLRDYVLSWFPGVARVWAGSDSDLLSGELLMAAGPATIDAGFLHEGPLGDQALRFTAGLTRTWTMPAASSCNFTSATTTLLLLVFAIESFTGGTEYTLIGNRTGADLAGFEVAINTSGALVVRFDAGAGAPTEVTLQAANITTGLVHVLALKYDHASALIAAATELEVGTASFAASASSSAATALGAYRSLNTPSWRCPLVAVFNGDAAEALDPVTLAKYVHAAYPNYPDHVEQLRMLLGQDVKPDLCWAGGGAIAESDGLETLQSNASAAILQVPITALAGPFALTVSGSQAWVADDATIGHLDTDNSALIVICADLVSFTAGVFEDLCGDRTVVLDAGWEIGISSAGVPFCTLDDNVGGSVAGSLTSASATVGKHVYLLRWIGATQQAVFASEVSSAALNFAGRTPVTAAPFRIGKTRSDLNSVNWNALHVAILYTEAFDAFSASELVSLAAALKAQI